MARYFLEVMYNGVLFHGSQVQRALPTVQLAINQSLTTLFRTQIESFGASRTDEGVHALCNYYHFDTDQELHDAFLYKMNAILPQGIAVKKLFKANDPELNSRFAAITRSYRYRIYSKKDPFLVDRAFYYPYKLDKTVLTETAAILKEYTHFESFAKRNSQAKTFTCNILQSLWEEKDGELQYVVTGNRFLRGMVRGLVGTQIQIARGRFNISEFRKIIEANDCTRAYFNVPGHGLYLEDIIYPEGALTEIKDKKEISV